MVLFDNSAYAAKPISSVAETDMEAIKKHVLEIYPQGGTNMSSGMLEATKMLEAFKNKTGSDYESRIIFLTDAMPNKGMLNRKDIASIASTNADHKIFSTFIGIGVDFNSGLVDSITKIRGANYYSVHSSKEFKKRMDDEFEYMVTPLVFNLQLKLDAPGYKLLKVYGSPEADLATGEIMKVNTLFPSSQVDGEVKGGLVLLHLRKVSDDTSITLSTSYEDRDGANGNSVKSVSFKNNNIEYYDNSGIRKGILLSRYTNLLKHWIIDERAKKMPEPPKYHGYETLLTRCGTVGIPVMHPPVALGRWERTSMPLTVSGDYSALFRDFNTYFKSEAAKTGDESMVEKESTVLNTLGDK
jgi:Ca-activated chloride channel family protein